MYAFFDMQSGVGSFNNGSCFSTIHDSTTLKTRRHFPKVVYSALKLGLATCDGEFHWHVNSTNIMNVMDVHR